MGKSSSGCARNMGLRFLIQRYITSFIIDYKQNSRWRAQQAFIVTKKPSFLLKKLSQHIEIINVIQQDRNTAPRPLRYWSQDESRFGLKTITRRVLTALGIKPVGPVQWNFQSFYLYGVVEPLSGESFFLEFSHLDAKCFQLFLDEFSKAFPDSLNVIQLDNGRFHSAKSLVIPDNIVLLFQPPYSPDTNPIERVWRFMKDKLCWMALKNLDELREKVDEILQSLSPSQVASLTGFDFILSALKVVSSNDN